MLLLHRKTPLFTVLRGDYVISRSLTAFDTYSELNLQPAGPGADTLTTESNHMKCWLIT